MKDSTIKSLWWLVKLQFKNSWTFSAWAIFYSFYSGASSIASVYFGAKFLSQVTAVAFNKSGTTQVYMWLGLLFGVQVVSAILGALNSLFERRFQQRMELSMNELLIRKMYELSQEQFDNQAFNTKLSRARESLFSMWRLTSDMSQLASALVRFISAIGAITIVAPLMGVIIAVTVMIVAGVRARQNKQIEAMYKSIEPYDRVAYRTRWMLIDPNTMPEIRLMNAFKHLLSSWSTNLTKSQNAIYNHDKRWAPLNVATDMIEPVVSVTATVYFLQRLISGVIGLDRFIFLRGLIDQANNAAGSIASSFQRIHDSTVKIQSFIEIYNQQPTMPNGDVKVEAPLTIELRHVSFSYPGSKRQILNDISFIIVPGSKLALVGENGAGKSTLIKLLLRQYTPTSGEILINGTPIQDIEQTSYYAAISNLSQNFLMVSHLTIRDNLLMGLARKTNDTTMHRAAEMVGASDFIAKLPHKYDQRLDPSFDDGTGLSGGQQQRLGVARALLREGDIMILDEPTSAIDAKAEYAIFNNIYKYHSGKTTLIVSHRFSTVRKADKIIVLDGGTITEYGSHEELLEYNGLYREMFDTQAEGYK